jgi:hypothetical protein
MAPLAFATARNKTAPPTDDNDVAADLAEVLADVQESSRMLVLVEELIPARRRSQPV